MRKPIQVLVLAGLMAGLINDSYGNGTSAPSGSGGNNPGQRVLSLYDQGMEATRGHNFQMAMELFDRALKEDPKNPDILNMLAHSQRKVGKIDDAIANYKKALELRPYFPEGREYLGEAYLQAAQEQMGILKSYKEQGAEQLEDLTKALKEAAKNL
jgi:tetratricopeptide (TPR) repeat protein